MKAQRVIVVGGYDKSLLNFRGALLQAMVHAGHTVVGAAPAETPGVAQSLSQIGVRFVSVNLDKAGLNILADILSLLRLWGLLRRERPDVLLSYTIKPVIYGSIAAGWAGIPRPFALITGLGAAFNTAGIKGALLRFGAVFLYRLACARCTKIFVQNQEIAKLFAKENIAPANKIVVVPGSGVDTRHFAFTPIPQGAPVFLLLARMLRDKGIVEYVEAARQVKNETPTARFLLVGDADRNPSALARGQLKAWEQEGAVEYLPAVGDVRPLLSECTVYVLPSYHEGMPRSVLEAMATGRPVITTDAIGCRETVVNVGMSETCGIRMGDNGILVPVRAVAPLAAAMLRLARDPALCNRMGRCAREIAEQRFDVMRVNQQMMEGMGLAPAPLPEVAFVPGPFSAQTLPSS